MLEVFIVILILGALVGGASFGDTVLKGILALIIMIILLAWLGISKSPALPLPAPFIFP
ncbi:MAG: hypothetical protein K6E31_08990 [bacterium]|nr:hypothetical protein [bacterium]